MAPLFRQGALTLFDELLFMPAVPFRYYALAFRNYVLAGVFPELEASDAANSFLSLILARLQRNPDEMRPVMPELLPAAEYVAANQERFEASAEIYGSFPAKLERIRSLYQDA